MNTLEDGSLPMWLSAIGCLVLVFVNYLVVGWMLTRLFDLCFGTPEKRRVLWVRIDE